MGLGIQFFREDILSIYPYVTNHVRTQMLKTTSIHFAHKPAVWAGLTADRSFLFHAILAVTARLGLADQLLKCVTHMAGADSLGAQPR